MQRVLLVLIIISASVKVTFSQANFILLPSDTAVVTQYLNTNDIAEGFIKVKNISNHNDTIKWVGVNKTGPHDWTANVCDILNCYSFSYIVRTFILAPGDTGTMRMDLDAVCQPGTGEIRLMMWEYGDSAGKVLYPNWQLNITVASGCVAGIDDNSTTHSLKIYPNPVQHSFVVSGLNNTGNFSFEVYDMKGALVKSEIKNATNTAIEISIENLPAGTYVLKAFDRDNRIAGTARLSKID